jgi:hypothetical protein
MADKVFTYSDVSEHSTKKDLYIVVHDKVYNASSFVDEHPYVCPYHFFTDVEAPWHPPTPLLPRGRGPAHIAPRNH